MILYINACVRRESRTDELARELLRCIGEPYRERKLGTEPLSPLSREKLDYRTGLISSRSFDDPVFGYAKEFAAADTIVISAPLWDLSFPTLLSEYIENIYVTGIVSRYREDGTPEGLCRAGKLYYVTTSGGVCDPRFGFDYIRELCTRYFGIKDVKLFSAEMLDIYGNDPAAILGEAKREINRYFGKEGDKE